MLEIACGTGLVTRRLRERIDPASRLVASDISRAMLDYARKKLIHCEGIDWCEADAARLPFGAGEFRAVVCAFGVMFVPDKRAVFREVRRVLGRGGIFLFNVWDRLEENPAAASLRRRLALPPSARSDLTRRRSAAPMWPVRFESGERY